MTIESATYISDLNASNPSATDYVAEGDDHTRLIKSCIKATWPNVSSAVTPTHTELNYVDGVTSAIQTQIDLKAPKAAATFTGTTTVAEFVCNGYAYTPTSSQTFTATPTFNAALSNVFEMAALTGNVTSVTITNPKGGQTIMIRLLQNGTGGYTVASPTGAKILGSMGATADAASILTLTYSALSTRWEGSWTNLPS
jgi:hypothetical protein